MIAQDIVYNGSRLSSRWLRVTKTNYYAPAERVVETIEVPGRSGDLVVDGKRYSNREVIIECISQDYGDDVRGLVRLVADVMESAGGAYKPLELYLNGADTTDEYLLARYTGMEVELLSLADARFTLHFDARPQRFLQSGDTWISFRYGGTIHNPTQWASSPLIEVQGHGSFTFDGKTVAIAEIPDNPVVYIDSDAHTCTGINGLVDYSDYITLPNHQYPTLPGSYHPLTVTGDFQRLQIKPRWWKV